MGCLDLSMRYKLGVSRLYTHQMSCSGGERSYPCGRRCCKVPRRVVLVHVLVLMHVVVVVLVHLSAQVRGRSNCRRHIAVL